MLKTPYLSGNMSCLPLYQLIREDSMVYKKPVALSSVAQLVEHHATYQEIAGSILVRAHAWARSPGGGAKEAASFSLSLPSSP